MLIGIIIIIIRKAIIRAIISNAIAIYKIIRESLGYIISLRIRIKIRIGKIYLIIRISLIIRINLIIRNIRIRLLRLSILILIIILIISNNLLLIAYLIVIIASLKILY